MMTPTLDMPTLEQPGVLAQVKQETFLPDMKISEETSVPEQRKRGRRPLERHGKLTGKVKQPKERVKMTGRAPWIPMEIDYKIQAKLVEFIELRGITQAELASRINKTKQAIGALIYMHQQMTVSRLWELSVALGVPIRAFFDDEWEPTMDSRAGVLWKQLTADEKDMTLGIMRTFVNKKK